MITKIKNAITKKISDEFKLDVFTIRAVQNVKPPCFFVEMFPTTVTAVDAVRNDVVLGVRVAYVSKDGAEDELIDVIKRLNKLFLRAQLNVKTDFIKPSTEKIDYDKDVEILIAEWQYRYSEKS